MASTDERFDQLESKLFGTEDIHPGILVRMDQRLKDLEGNPAIQIGKELKRITLAVIFLGGLAYAWGYVSSWVVTAAATVTGKPH